MKPSLLRPLTLLLCLPWLAGCLSSVLPEAEQTELYQFPPSRLTAGTAAPSPALVVERPTAIAALEGDRLLAIVSSGEVQRVGNARWVGDPAGLVQDALIERLRQLQAASSVDRNALRLGPAWRLQGELRALHYQPDRDQASVELMLHLICPGHGSLGQRRFRADVQPAARAPDAIVLGLAEGLDQIAVDVAHWLASSRSECAPAEAGSADSLESRGD